MENPGPLRVFVVDDHPIVRAGVRLVIQGLPGFELCGETGRPEGAPEAAAHARADAVILDLMLGGGRDGLELVAAMRSALPKARLLVFSMNAEELFAERVLKAGANGYLMKGGDLSQLQNALVRLARGETVLSPTMKERLDEARRFGPRGAAPLASLSDRELQVFMRLGAGRSTHQIAEELGVSMKTVSAHRENLKTKLGAASAPELVRQAVEYVVAQGRERSS
jgi:DNA-binding NarL/FixJ family response regulator